LVLSVPREGPACVDPGTMQAYDRGEPPLPTAGRRNRLHVDKMRELAVLPPQLSPAGNIAKAPAVRRSRQAEGSAECRFDVDVADGEGHRQSKVATEHLSLRHIENVGGGGERINRGAWVQRDSSKAHGRADVGAVEVRSLRHIGPGRRRDARSECRAAEAIG